MIFFTIIVVVALIFAVLAVGGFLPFWSRDQGSEISAALRVLLLERAEGKVSSEEFERRQAALHASLIGSPQQDPTAKQPNLRMIVIVVISVVVVPLVVLYAFIGKPKDIETTPAPVAFSEMNAQPPKTQLQSPPKANSGGDLNVAVKHLADKMAKDPNNGEGWLLLARTYGELRQSKEAAAAYSKAAALIPLNAAMLSEWADAHVLANGRKWDDESRDIVKRALVSDPKNLKALALAGSEAFDRADYKQAVILWKRLQAAAPADSQFAKLAEMNIKEANSKLAGK
ncbi:TPR domain-containing protein [Sulfurirhabdus autotrophica]|uniref:Cytochrome c-type biogenesis protein CcmH n=1 Tax=Sulfurirhabdus autotrophica TaxID=1706046 RepID=A0A4R3YC12_9PROT|nr:hypothetical protein [Sulfurirhabdus autotrophica]TCV89510.1 cytochrome c-type biogenesis protein CcmH [Sulfurirhabdus autotrophica]